jgi:hypothetical protein
MDKIGPSPFSWLEFDAGGSLKDAGAAAAVEAMLNAPEITDFVVLSHGWNNSKADAMTLYRTLWGNVAGALTHSDPAHIAVAGVVWPAKAFSTDFDDAAAVASAAGQTLSVGSGGGGGDLDEARFEATIKGSRTCSGRTARRSSPPPVTRPGASTSTPQMLSFRPRPPRSRRPPAIRNCSRMRRCSSRTRGG